MTLDEVDMLIFVNEYSTVSFVRFVQLLKVVSDNVYVMLKQVLIILEFEFITNAIG